MNLFVALRRATKQILNFDVSVDIARARWKLLGDGGLTINPDDSYYQIHIHIHKRGAAAANILKYLRLLQIYTNDETIYTDYKTLIIVRRITNSGKLYLYFIYSNHYYWNKKFTKVFFFFIIHDINLDINLNLCLYKDQNFFINFIFLYSSFFFYCYPSM